MEKRKVILIGSSTCGKTTLCQRLNGLTIHYHKTQTIGLINNMIDTPGEYLENRNMYKGIIVAATDSDLVLFLQDATDVGLKESTAVYQKIGWEMGVHDR